MVSGPSRKVSRYQEGSRRRYQPQRAVVEPALPSRYCARPRAGGFGRDRGHGLPPLVGSIANFGGSVVRSALGPRGGVRQANAFTLRSLRSLPCFPLGARPRRGVRQANAFTLRSLRSLPCFPLGARPRRGRSPSERVHASLATLAALFPARRSAPEGRSPSERARAARFPARRSAPRRVRQANALALRSLRSLPCFPLGARPARRVRQANALALRSLRSLPSRRDGTRARFPLGARPQRGVRQANALALRSLRSLPVFRSALGPPDAFAKRTRSRFARYARCPVAEMGRGLGFPLGARAQRGVDGGAFRFAGGGGWGFGEVGGALLET